MPLPGNGVLSLQGHSRPGDTLHSKPKQAMIVRMSAETLELLEAFPNQPPMDFQFGENTVGSFQYLFNQRLIGEQGIYIGDTFFPMRPLKENTPHELYLRASSVAKPMAPLKLYANVTGKFTVERELGTKVEDKVRDRTLVAEKKRTERKAIMLDTPPPDLAVASGKKRKAPAMSSMFRKPVQPSDHLPVNRGPTPSRVASPAPSTMTREGLVPVRKRLIHCVALGQHTPEAVIKLVGGTDRDPAAWADLLALLDEASLLHVSYLFDTHPFVFRLRNQYLYRKRTRRQNCCVSDHGRGLK
jgi:RNA polymerase II elongation factor ELL